MSNTLADMRYIRFLLYEVLNIEEKLKFPFFADHSRETFDMALDAAYQLAQEVFWPTYQQVDHEGAKFDGEKVTLPKAMHDIWNHCKEGGWFAPDVSYDLGGSQYPLTIFGACVFLFNCGDTSASMLVFGTGGAGRLIQNSASQKLVDIYVPKLCNGEWGGTMALTEPDAGTSLGDLKTSATPLAEEGCYAIKGVKRFISSGDQDITENIVHPVLARIQGAPPGIKGISLFIVPKYRVNDDGSIGEFNNVTTAGIEHKMGLKGQPTATLNFGEKGECRGYLIGEPNKGLKYMFQLMNHARVFTGIQSIAGASTAYHCALAYTRERLQGRPVTNLDPTSPQVPLIEFTDVRRMLLEQKAFIEGMLSLILYCGILEDQVQQSEDAEEKDRLHQIVELLTPCCKAHGSDGAFRSIVNAMQCFGGSGYCEEYPIAQIMRDNKVFSIYEGANGIQAMDLLGRKIPTGGGTSVRFLMKAIGKDIKAANELETLKPIAEKVLEIQNEVVAAIMHLSAIGLSGEIEKYIANATMFLEMFSQMLLSWQLLRNATVAQKALDAGTTETNFYTSKIETARFYVNTSGAHAIATAKVLMSNETTALDFKPEWF